MDSGRNPLPLTANVKPREPTVTEVGAMLLTVSAGGTPIVTLTAFEVALPGFETVIATVPGPNQCSRHDSAQLCLAGEGGDSRAAVP